MSTVLEIKDSSGWKYNKNEEGVKGHIFYYDFEALVVMLVVACDQMVDVGTIATDALACDFDGF